jgi:FKBP-type peptidyl-prolyl cis-trans isomerase
VRKSVALIVAAGLLAALAGCSSSSDSAAGCTPAVTAGPASNLITATGDFNTAPKVSTPSPFDTQTTEATTLIAGTGAVLPADGIASANYTIIDATTGATIGATPYDGTTSSTFPISNFSIPGMAKGLTCATAGSRVAIAISPTDGFGDAGTQYGVAATDTLVAVVDLNDAFGARANGSIQPAQAGFPGVVRGPDGRPGITIPSGTVPTDLKVATLIKGTGAPLTEGQAVLVQYTAVVWADKSIAKSTWQDGSPAVAEASSTAPLSTTLVPSLVGQTIGSQYIAVVPPSAGFGSTASSAPVVPANSTLVYVVDVLGVLPPAPQQASN